MFDKTPKELVLKDFSNIYNKCQSTFELVTSRKYNESLVLLTTAETYAIAEKPIFAAILPKSCKQRKSLLSLMLLRSIILN